MTLDAFGVERGDLAKKAPDAHIDVRDLDTPEGLDRGIAMTDAVRRYHQKKAKHGAYATLAGLGTASAGGLSLHKLPRAGGAAVVGGGALALGGLTHMQHHGLREDVARHNEAVLIGAKRQRAAAEEMAGAKPAGVAKYQLPGDNPQAEAARERKKSGLGLAGVGYLVASRHKDVTPGAVDLITRPAKKGADAGKVLARDAKIANRTKAINTVSSRGGAAAVGLGLAMAGEGLASDWRHRKVLQRAQGKLDDHVKAYRENRDRRENSLTKSAFGVEDPRIGKAFDPERQRHRRQSVYEGAATGGAVVSATGAGVLGRKALIQRQVAGHAGPRAVAHHTELQESLNANAKPPNGTTTEEMGRRFAVAARKHRMAEGSAHTAVNAASKTRRFATLGGAAGLGAAALGAAAYGIHRRDTAGHGRGY